MILNFAFVITELVFGFRSHSIALIADAGHNFSDVVGLGLSLAAIWLSGKKPSSKFTYGLRRSSILASLANSVLLLVSVGVIVIEAVQRWMKPETVDSTVMVWVALAGIVINVGTALLFLRENHDDLNVKSAFVHMAGDAVLALGVVLSGVLIHFTQWNWLDPVMSIVISLVIVWGTWRVLKESTQLAVDAVPDKVDQVQVRKYLEALDGVAAVHDLHIWGMSTTEVALTAHLVVKTADRSDQLLNRVCTDLKSQFQIDHSTIQFESLNTSYTCHLEPDDVV